MNMAASTPVQDPYPYQCIDELEEQIIEERSKRIALRLAFVAAFVTTGMALPFYLHMEIKTNGPIINMEPVWLGLLVSVLFGFSMALIGYISYRTREEK